MTDKLYSHKTHTDIGTLFVSNNWVNTSRF